MHAGPTFVLCPVRALFLLILLSILPSEVRAADQARRVVVIANDALARQEVEAIKLINETPGMAAIERAELDRALGEKVLQQRNNLAAIGQVMAADLLVHLSESKGEVRVDLVGAEDGRLIQSGKYNPEALREMLKAAQATTAKKERVAVMSLAGERSPEAAAALGEFLVASEAVVLDRDVVQHVAREHGLAENGLTDADAEKIAPILGADVLVLVKGERDQLVISLVSPESGSLLATERFPWAAGSEPPKEARAWLTAHLAIKAQPSGEYFPEIQIEALKPFYDGIAKYRSGQVVEALQAFEVAYNFNDKFYEALLWQAQCYDAMGLPHMAMEVRRYASRCLVGRGISAPTERGAVEGLCFLGVASADPAKTLALNNEALKALQRASAERILLPDHLAAWREEYDALSRVDRTQGIGWARAPRYFVQKSVHGTVEADGSISWSLMDNVNGRLLARATVPAGSEGEQKKALEGVLRKLLAAQPEPTVPPTQTTPLTWPKARNLDLLHKVIETPEDDSLWGAKLKINGDDYSGLEAFLNFGLSEELIARLPADHPHRLWLELLRIYSFLPVAPRGKLMSGENPNPVLLLKKFAEDHAGTAAGETAAYMYEYETLPQRSFPEIASRWDHLIERLRGAQGFQPASMRDSLLAMATHLRDLALIAQGKTEGFTYLPTNDFPRRPELSIEGPQRIRFQGYHYFDAGEWRYVKIPRERWPQEAAVAIRVMYGRPTWSRVIDPRWQKEYPDSFCLLDFSIRTLLDVDHDDSMPMREPFEGKKAREDFRKTLTFCEEKLLEQLANLQDVTQFDYVCSMGRHLITSMHQYQFANEISDGEYYDMQRKVAEALDAMAARLNLGRASDWCGDYWRTMPRWDDLTKLPDDWHMMADVRGPAQGLEREAQAGKTAFAESPARDKEWLRVMRSGELRDWSTAEQRANIAAKYLKEMEQFYGEGPLSSTEMAFILEYAQFLGDGGYTAEAERWFRRVADQPLTDLVRFGNGPKLILQGKFNLALMMQRQNREREALELAGEVLAESGDRPTSDVTSSPNESREKETRQLRTKALRLVRNMRLHDLAKGKENLRVVTVEAPESAQKAIRFYFRLPGGYATQKDKARILVLNFSWTHSAPDYCFGTNTWTRFCDAMGWVLCGPDFEEYLDNEGHPYRNPEVWSGKALLTAVDELAATERVDAEKLLLHGYGAGGQFAGYFSRYAPERCLAVSVNGVGNVPGKDYLPRLKGLNFIKEIPFLVTIGEEDDKRQEYWDRLALAISNVSSMEEAGIRVIWRAWPEVGHWPTPEMERLAQTFLAEAAKLGGLPAEVEFIGNRTTGEYYPAGSAEAKKIPGKYQQPLPNLALAKAWKGQ